MEEAHSIYAKPTIINTFEPIRIYDRFSYTGSITAVRDVSSELCLMCFQQEFSMTALHTMHTAQYSADIPAAAKK